MTAICDDRHVFPRDSFAGVGSAVVLCRKPSGHAGAHEGRKRTTAFVWGASQEAAVDDDAE